MNYKCSECNFEFDGKFKFCPECGNRLGYEENIEENSDINNETEEHLELIICDNCGAENTTGSLNCVSCGFPIKEDKTTIKKEVKPAFEKHSSPEIKPVKKVKQNSNKKKKQEQVSDSQTSNELSSKQIGIIVGVVLTLALIVLIGSGVFDTKPGVTFTQTDMGSGQVNLQNLDRINQLEATVKANPENHNGLIELANLLFDSGLFERAIIYYRQYLEVHPENADARIDLGVCYYEIRDYETAIKEMESALKYQADHQIGHFNLGIVNLAAGNREKSREWFEKTIVIDPASSFGKRAKELIESH